jgi:peptidoglycan lytic transglycosylase F
MMTGPVRLAAAVTGILLAGFLIGHLAFRWQLLHAESGPGGASKNPRAELIHRDLDAIREKGTLTVLAPYNSTSYFIYRGQPMGFEYQLLQAFAEEQGLKVRVVVVRDGDQLGPMLRRGEGDLIAARLIAPGDEEAAKQGLAFTRGLYRTKPALVQQKQGKPDPRLPKPVKKVIKKKEREAGTEAPGAPPDPAGSRINARLITRPSQLAGKEVTLPKGSAFQRTLVEVEQEISGDIHVVEVGGGVDVEALIERVSTGEVDLTVAQENLARLKESVYTNLIIIPTLGPSHSISWAVRENSPRLLSELNYWIEKEQDGPVLRELYKKYFINRRRYRERVKSRYLTSRTGRLSAYDPLLKEHAPALGWDWRLLASQAYQESRFQPRARSWAGAAGVLQLMPGTARQFGVRDRYDPRQNVRGAVKFLKWLQVYWKDRIPDEGERLKFILASYNAGHGHVEDGRRLTEVNGDDPLVWDEVAYWMLQLSQKEYYTDPVVRYGYCRGLEPVTYVGLILERYDHYRQFVDRS